MTPKMQLSADVMVSDTMRAEMNAWMIDFFGYEEDKAAKPVTPVFNDANLVAQPPKDEKRQAARKKRTQVQPDTESFRSLLDGLEDTFYTMRVPPISGSWLTKKEVSTIKKMGVFIPTEFVIELSENPIVTDDTPKPAVASALFVPKKHDENDKCFARFAYALRAAKLPENVEATRGTPYQFGMCFEMKHTEKGADMSPRLFWSWCWIVIRPDGSIRIPHEMRQVSAQIIHRRSLAGSKGSHGARSSTAHMRHWALPTMAVAEVGKDQAEYEKFLRCSFLQLLVWWGQRSEQWSVGVRKDGHRATFSIDPKHTSAYFADRETVVNVQGQPKKIIHFVRQHTRVNGSEVKAHVRGLREFDWKGYHCFVTAPKLRGDVFTQFGCAPVEVDSKELPPGMLDTQELSTMLADAEDFATA